MPGTITFKPIEANLNHDKDIIGKADPYCMFIVNGEKIKSQVCKSGGTHPIWDDAITIPASNQPTCFVEIKDKDILKDDKLGSFEIDLREIESQGRLKKWYPIFHKDKPAGEILMEAVFSPQGGYQQGLGGYQQQGMPLQTGAPLQTHGAPIHSTAIPITSQSIPGQQTLHTQGVLLGTQPLGQPITHSIGQPLGQPIGQPITQQTQHIITKETVLSNAPLGQQQFQPGMQYSGMLPGQGLADSSYGYGYTGESMSEHYAKEALIRGVDPLGTHLHQYPEQMLGSQLVGGIPQSNLTSGIMNPGLQQNLPGQQLPGQLPGQLNQRNIM